MKDFYKENKRELLEGGHADCEFWKRLVGYCNFLTCWRKTRFLSAVPANVFDTRVKFNVFNRDPRTRYGHGDVTYRQASKVIQRSRTFRSSAIHIYNERLTHETHAEEVSAVVDALSAIEDFEAFDGFKRPGGWGVLADGSRTSIAIERKKRVAKRSRKRKIATPRPKKGNPTVSEEDDEEPDDEEEVAEDLEDAASKISQRWRRVRNDFVGKRMATFFKAEDFESLTTLLCNIAQRTWTLGDAIGKLCVEIKNADDDAARELSMGDVTEKQRCHLLDKIRCVSKAFSIVAAEPTITWEVACALTSVHFWVPYGAPPPAGRTISRWGVDFVQQGCRFNLNDQGYHKHPWIFEDNEDCKQDALKFLRKNIHGLSTEMFAKHINDELLPAWRLTCNFSPEELKTYSIEDKIHQNTAYRWMVRLGFRYSTIKKHFYTDNRLSDRRRV